MSENPESFPLHSEQLEAILHQWWRERFNAPLPDDVRESLRGIIRKEVSRLRLNDNLLDASSLQKIHDNRRLCQTKLAHLDGIINELKRQLERLDRYMTVNTELTEQHERLYRINK